MVAPAPIRTRLTRTRAETARSAGGSPRHLPEPCSWHPIPMAPRSRLPSGCPAPAAQRTMNGSMAVLATISSARVCASWRRRPVPGNPASPTCIWRRWRCCRRIDDAALATLWWQQSWPRHSHRAPARSPVPPRLRVSGAVACFRCGDRFSDSGGAEGPARSLVGEGQLQPAQQRGNDVVQERQQGAQCGDDHDVDHGDHGSVADHLGEAEEVHERQRLIVVQVAS